MTRQLFANDILTTLAADVDASATTIVVSDATTMPVPSADEYFLLTLWDGTNKEIVKVTARNGTTLTVQRGQEGTTPRAWATGTYASMTVTAGTAANWLQKGRLATLPFSDRLQFGNLQLWYSPTLDTVLGRSGTPTSETDGFAAFPKLTVTVPDDGVTDAGPQLQNALDAAPTAHLRIEAPHGGTVRIASPVRLPSDIRLDLSGVDVVFGPNGRIEMAGDDALWPEGAAYGLTADAPANATLLRLDASALNGDMSVWTPGARGRITEGGTSHDFTVVTVSGNDLTIDPPLPAAFTTAAEVRYRVVRPLGAAVAEGATVLTLASDASMWFAAGDLAVLEDDAGREPVRIAAVSGTTVTLSTPVGRPVDPATGGRLRRLAPVSRSILYGPRTYALEPSAARGAPFVVRKVQFCRIYNLFRPTLDPAQTVLSEDVLLDEAFYAYVDSVRTLQGTLDAADNGNAVRCTASRYLHLTNVVATRQRSTVVLHQTNSVFLENVAAVDNAEAVVRSDGGNRNVSLTSVLHTGGQTRLPDNRPPRLLIVSGAEQDRGWFATDLQATDLPEAVIRCEGTANGLIVDGLQARNVGTVLATANGTVAGGHVVLTNVSVDGDLVSFVDDDATAAAGFVIHLGPRGATGVVMTDVDVTGSTVIHFDLVPDKGSLLHETVTVTTTPYVLGPAEQHLYKAPTEWDIRQRRVVVGNPDATARDFVLPADAEVGRTYVIEVPDAHTGTVTLSAAAGATIASGSPTQVVPPLGNRARVVVAFCHANADGTSAEWVLAGDVVPVNEVYSVPYPLDNPRPVADFSTSTSFSALPWRGAAILRFIGSAAATLTLDTLPDVRPGVPYSGIWTVLNAGSADLTVQAAVGSFTVLAGRAARLVRAGTTWYVLDEGAYVT